MHLLRKLLHVLVLSLLSINIYSQEQIAQQPPNPDCNVTTIPSGTTYVGKTGSTTYIQVTADDPSCTWDVSDDAYWVMVSPTSGTGNGVITVEYQSNPTASTRPATITIEDQTLQIIQAAGCGSFIPQKSLTISNPINAQDCNIYSGVIQARDYVQLDGTFSYSAATSAPLTIKPNADLFCAATYVTDPVDGSTRKLSTNAEVGSLRGSINVSPSGAATYTIPILIPSGTKGIQPSINISYNSQQGRSQLGKGFSISGFSAISRTPRNHYYDGEVGGLMFDMDDRLTLDGNRLMLISTGTYGADGTEYRTEQNTFAKITAVGELNDQYFEVETKDGKILEYGKTYNSKSKVPAFGAPFKFYLNRVTDGNGNYMTYTYETANGETKIKRINYTGNDDLTPYNSILFYYEEREDQKPYYINGSKITPKVLLREIDVKTNDNLIRKYSFVYAKNDLNESYLSEVIESNSIGEKYNSTVINWGDNNLFNIAPKITTIPLSNYAEYSPKYYTSCDFNGDGLSDLVSFFDFKWVKEYPVEQAVQIYTAESDENGNVSFNEEQMLFYQLGGSVYPPEESDWRVDWEPLVYINKGPFFGDMLGNGVMDIIVPTFISNDDGKMAIFKIANRKINLRVALQDNELPLYTLADFDKNGRANFVFLENKLVDGFYKGGILEITNEVYAHNGYDITSGELTGYDIYLDLYSEPKAIFTGDYNNDGLTDLRVATVNGIWTFMNQDGIINQSPANHTTFSNVTANDFNQGDFNGDGLPDLLIIGNTGENIAVAYGGGVKNSCYLTMQYFPTIGSTYDIHTNADNDKDNCIITDFNNDGLSDFILFNAIYEWHNGDRRFNYFTVNWYESTGNGFNMVEESISYTQEQAFKKYFTGGDFNGDGRSELLNFGFECYNESNTTSEWRYYGSFNENFEAEKVKAIYNGFNHKTEIKYRPLSAHSDNPDFYIKGTSGINDVVKYQTPMYMVSSIAQPDGIGGTSTTSYTYEGLQGHINGKGLLGFEKMTAYNDVSKIKTETFNELDPTYFVVKKQTSTVTDVANNKLISSNIIDNQVITDALNSKVVFNRPLKITSLNGLTNTTVTKDFSSYDGYGNLLSSKETYGSDVAIIDVTNTYTDKGSWCDARLTSSTVTNTYDGDSETKVSNFTYDDNGNLLTSSANDISVSYDIYDQFGNVMQQTTNAPDNKDRIISYTYDPTGRFVYTTTNVLNQPSNFYYNDLGQLITETGVDGQTNQYAYDYWGKLKTITYPNGKKSNYSTHWSTDGVTSFYNVDKTDGIPEVESYCDDFGRTVNTETTGFKGKMLSEVFYNRKGQVEKTRFPYYVDDGYSPSHEIGYTYDPYGRTASVTNNGLTTQTSYADNVITETYPSGKTKVTTMDVTGKVENIVNNDVSMDYSYFCNGRLKDVTAPGSFISMTYDDNGFQNFLDDPDAGQHFFNYDAYGQLKSKTSPIGSYSATYDKVGRIETETGYGNIVYSYVTSGNGLNQVDIVSDNGVEFQNFDYDQYGRVTKLTEQMGDQSMAVSYIYDDYGRTTAINYPGGFGIKYSYDTESGELEEIYTNKDSLVWKLQTVNSHNQITKYKHGNDIETKLSYDSNNMLDSISIGAVQNISYTFDADYGRFDNRTGLVTGVTETFDYDDHNQLKTVVAANKPELNLIMTYNAAVPGQMSSKSDIGTYQYTQERNAGPHAVSGLTSLIPNYSPTDQVIDYTSFGKVLKITQGNYRIDFTYGPDLRRKTMEVYESEVLQRKVYYFGNYERHEEGGNVTELYYIFAGTGLTAIYKKDNGENAGTIYYVHTDYLGSLATITGSDKNVKARYYYNPWGERRNINKTTGNTFQIATDLPWLHRGFTGHEHITEIGLINMNGRVYDPDLGMFISPDPFIQAPDNPVNFNRYAYCLNNPLVYTDPSGNSISGLFWAGVAVETIGNLIYGVDNPIGTAFDDVSEMFNEASTCLQFDIYQSENIAITAGFDPLNAGISANLYYRDENTSGSISAGVGLLNGFSVNASQSFTYKGWETGGSVGIGSNYKGWNANIQYEGYGVGYGQTYYGDEIGSDGLPNNQTTGTFTAFFNHNSFRFENDRLGDGEDRWKTFGMEVEIDDFVIGTQVYTTMVKNKKDIDESYLSKIYGLNITRYGNKGAYSKGFGLNSPIYFGFKMGNRVERLGWNHYLVQDFFQNGWHKIVWPTPYFQTGDYSNLYYYSGYFNNFTLY